MREAIHRPPLQAINFTRRAHSLSDRYGAATRGRRTIRGVTAYAPVLPAHTLERALFAGRLATALAVLGLGLLLPGPSLEAVGALAGAILVAGAVLYLGGRWAERRGGGLEPSRFERAIPVAGVVTDLALVTAALAVFSGDPAWRATLVVPVAILLAAMRVGPRGALFALAALSLAHVAVAWWRSRVTGAELEPLTIAAQVAIYALAAVVAGGIAGALDTHVASRDRTLRDLERRRMRDALTGLGDREFMKERLELAIATARRFGGGAGLLLVDLNDFRSVNDTFGHSTGDTVLRSVAERLRGLVRATDAVARIGGDEFALILPRADRAGGIAAAQKVLASLEQPLEVQGVKIALRASIGAVAFPDDGDDPAALIQHAEAALATARAQGGGQAAYDAGKEQQSAWGGMLLADLRDGLQRGELIPYFQPIVACSDRSLLAVEALVRWRHPRRGLVGPGEFVAYAEHVGLDPELLETMLAGSLAQLRVWRALGIAVPASVNLSARNLLDPDLVPTLERALTVQQADPSWLELEITETMVLLDRERARATISALRGLGFKVAIDDFGTGYSSLRYLQGLECDSLKIDQTFVRGMVSDRASATIVRASIDLGHALGMRTTAEGIEDETTLGQLVAMGCDKAQGYLIARPMPGADLPAWHAGFAPRGAAVPAGTPWAVAAPSEPRSR